MWRLKSRFYRQCVRVSCLAGALLLILPTPASAQYSGVRLTGWTVRQYDTFRCIAYNTQSVEASGGNSEAQPDQTRFIVAYGLKPESLNREKPLHSFEIVIANPTWKDLPLKQQADDDEVIILLSGEYDLSIKLHGPHQPISVPPLNISGWGYVLEERAIGAPGFGAYADPGESTTNDLKNIGSAQTMTVTAAGTPLGRYEFAGWKSVADELRRCVAILQSAPR